jgi:Ran GTPase-activating protein (RanGAP) involved in mRNA processing and transport
MGGAASTFGSYEGPLVFNKTGEEKTLSDVRRGEVRHAMCLYAGLSLRDIGAIRSAGVMPKSHLLTLDLTGNKISSKGAKLIASLIWASPTLERLDLTDNSIGCQGAAALALSCRHTLTLEGLFLANNKIKDNGALQIARWLKPYRQMQDKHTLKLMTPKLKKLSLDGNDGITYVGWHKIAEMCGKNKMLENITTRIHMLNLRELNGGEPNALDVNLSKCMLGDFDGFVVAAELANNHILRHLDLSNNNISTMGCMALAEGLRSNCTLESLKLENNILGKEGIQALADALVEDNHKLELLQIGGEEICPALSGQDIVKVLVKNGELTKLQLNKKLFDLNELRGWKDKYEKEASTTTVLDLKGVCAQDSDCFVLRACVTMNRVLTDIDLSRNNVGPMGTRQLASLLTRNQTLTRLRLESNRVADLGARHLGAMLQINTTLRVLTLGNNSIGDIGAVALGESLKENEYLEELDLGRNMIGTMGGAELLEAVQSNHVLSKLNLSKNKLTAGIADQLGLALKANTQLADLDLHGNTIGEASAVELGEALIINEGLTKLNLTSNKLGTETGGDALANGFFENTNIQQAYVACNGLKKAQKWAITRKYNGEEVDIRRHAAYSSNPLPHPSEKLSNTNTPSSFGGIIPSENLEDRIAHII